MTGALTAAAWLVAAAAPAKKSGGISPIIIIYAVIAAGFYFLYYRPRKRKAQESREQANAWDVGDEVLTAGGIVGYIIDIDGDRVTLETSVGASFVVLKQYVLRKIDPVVEDDDDEVDEDDDEDHVEDIDEDHDEDMEEAESLDAEDADDTGADGSDAETQDSPHETEVAPEAGNRRSRRRGLRNQSRGDEDASDNDGPPTA
jgi:preprotein translocase subunit YajC